ncbi:hypothetical protein, partial [Cronobacter malonaticus]|uniref:hypothetical protein n=1 Tax=Cronobacter malonaticus TaxID=413503 RepID=UPI0018AF7313
VDSKEEQGASASGDKQPTVPESATDKVDSKEEQGKEEQGASASGDKQPTVLFFFSKEEQGASASGDKQPTVPESATDKVDSKEEQGAS